MTLDPLFLIILLILLGCSCVLIAAMAPRAARAGRITPGAIISFIALGAAAYEGEKAKQWAS